MQEFSSISVSAYEPDALVEQLNEHAAGGWEVVAVVPTGSTVTAYLSREANPEGAEPAAAPPAAAEPAPAGPEPEPAAEPAVAPQPEPAAAPAASEPIIPTAASTTAAEPAPAAEPAAQPATQAAAQATGGAPAGWYADPSSRFELRYWDGTTWTEHVSRGGQQYTDPPVA